MPVSIPLTFTVLVESEKQLVNLRTALNRAQAPPLRVAVSWRRGLAEVHTQTTDPERLKRALRAFKVNHNLA